MDIVALSGLNGHAFGSFKAKGESYMWLRGDLPLTSPTLEYLSTDIVPTRRIFPSKTYGT